MGALKLTYHESQTAISENWKIFVRGIEKNASSQNFCKDYFTFGSIMPGRNYNAGEYRFGFQGQEAENEIAGVTGAYSFFKYRISDNRLGRFFSVDPLAPKYPHNSPYAFSENRVIDAIELEGLEKFLVVNTYNNDGHITAIQVFAAKKDGQWIDMKMKGNGVDYTGTNTLIVNRNAPEGIPQTQIKEKLDNDVGNYGRLTRETKHKSMEESKGNSYTFALQDLGLKSNKESGKYTGYTWSLERPTLTPGNFAGNSALIRSKGLANDELGDIAIWGNVFNTLQIKIQGGSTFTNDRAIGSDEKPITDMDGNTFPNLSRNAGWLKDQRAGAYGRLLTPKMDNPSQVETQRSDSGNQISVEYE